jgi:hypothetical protein
VTVILVRMLGWKCSLKNAVDGVVPSHGHSISDDSLRARILCVLDEDCLDEVRAIMACSVLCVRDGYTKSWIDLTINSCPRLS